ncbi:transferase [Streptomyces anthocyanicus]|uniref:SCO3242 family prenyltransferase n=1 Tax=Streptomyces anthocyanicus TaxID=68174 RepID=UPI001874FCB2|nr:UbiA family prenyltransferase [Streptomyces anthocyanicus]GHC37462.1 transferase [Streptomyces anthocyanicus]
MSALPRVHDLARLVRAPAALSVPGDVLAGAAAARRPLGPGLLGMTASSVCLYWAGMALNDYADRDLDAVERPERPVPSGAVSPAAARAVGCGLTAAGLGLAALSRGRRGLATALPLAGVVWAYDLVLKPTPAGAAAMAAARALNVLGGAGPGGLRRALPAAATVALHTGMVTRLSRYEVSGAPRAVPRQSLAVGGAVGAAVLLRGRRRPARDRVLAAGLTAVYAYGGAAAQLAAVRNPAAPQVRRAVAAGIHALIPLQAALTATAGRGAAGAALACALPWARRLGRKVSPT